MRDYVIKRLLLLIPVLFLVSVLVFGMMRLLPGDIVGALMGDYMGANPEALREFRAMLGFDQPIYIQYFRWLGQVLRGDLGSSLLTGRPVLSEIVNSFPVTFELAVLSVVISVVVAIPIGIVSAVRQNSPLDFVFRLFAIGGLSIPLFWLAIVFLIFSAVYLHWMPGTRLISFNEDPLGHIAQFGIASIISAYRGMGVTARMTRSSLLDVLRQDYIRTAWAKGLRERAIIIGHALKNAMIPVVTITGNQFAHLLGGLVITETIFTLPGVGRLMVTSIGYRDYTTVQGAVLIIAASVVLVNLLVDLTYAWLDPRIRYQ